MVERKDVPLMEPKPVREAIINAFVHNRWVDGNAPMFTVYSDRLEILSRGPLPSKQTMDGFFRDESAPVNQMLSDIRSDPNATHDQIAASIGKGRTSVVKAIRQLREGGYIERVGSNKSGWWKVL